jgi:hypothetical protein
MLSSYEGTRTCNYGGGDIRGIQITLHLMRCSDIHPNIPYLALMCRAGPTHSEDFQQTSSCERAARVYKPSRALLSSSYNSKPHSMSFKITARLFDVQSLAACNQKSLSQSCMKASLRAIKQNNEARNAWRRHGWTRQRQGCKKQGTRG